MEELQDHKEDDVKECSDVRRARAPSKKKFDEEMEALVNSIRKTEEELEALKNAGPASFADALKNLKAEKNANIERRKKIDADLQKLNKEISEMMHSISRLESTLHYRSEDKTDEAIRRLEWNLKVQNFKLSQEKKIVAEIDSLRRSKKTLSQYLSMKKDKDAMRDRQRRMREERDYYFHKVTELKQREEKLRADNSGQKAKAEQLKKELDKLYEAKRQMVSVYKKQRESFIDDREKRRHESFKKRIEEKQAIQAALRKEREEYEAQKQPYEDDICLCNTLIHYLHRFISSTDLDSSFSGAASAAPVLPSPSEESPQPPSATGPAEELEDGQYVLLRKSEDDNYVTCSAKHAARKQRRSRKQSMVKKITHTPEVLSQFLQLTLNAPTTIAEVLASLEHLRARKRFYEQEREAEVKSDAELSVTESALCEVSRQASHTESNDGLSESRLSDQVVEQLLQLSVDNTFCPQGSDLDSQGQVGEGQGGGEVIENGDHVQKWKSEWDDYPALPQKSTPDPSQAGSTSDGCDLTPRNLTSSGVAGGAKDGQGHNVSDLDCSQGESATQPPRRPETLCDLNNDITNICTPVSAQVEFCS